MATKTDRSNRDADDSKRRGANSANENQTRKPAHANAARKIPSKSGGEDKPSRDSRAGPTD